MSAAEILNELHRDGVRLRADGETLFAEPRERITDDHRHLIRTHKPELLAVLRAANEPDGAHQADLDELVEERAAILEHDGGLSRHEAERVARGPARTYYNHLMRQNESGCGCRTNLGAKVFRLCSEGRRLCDAYRRATEAAR